MRNEEIKEIIDKQRRHNDEEVRHNNLKYWFSITIAIVMAIVTVLAIIVGVYGDIFDKYLREGKKKDYNVSDIIGFFTNQCKLANDSCYLAPPLEIEKNTTCFNHLMVIDRTMSTVFMKNDNKKTLFRKQLLDSLRNVFTLGYDTTDIKLLFINNLYRHIEKEQPVNFRNVFYDGIDQSNHIIFIDSIPKKHHIDPFTWVKASEKKYAIDLLLDLPLYANQIKYQHTDIKHIISKIVELCNNSKRQHIVVTLVSDFVHENKNENISFSAIEKLQEGAHRPEQFNIIYLVPNDSKIRAQSDKIVNMFRHKVEGTKQNYIEISTELYNDDIFTEDDGIAFELSLNQCFAYINSDNTVIKFYHPRKNKDFSTAECFLVLTDTISDFQWRIVTPFQRQIPSKEGSFIIHSKEPNKQKESTFDINGAWHEQRGTDTLQIKFPLTARMYGEQFDLEMIQNGVCKRYPILFNEYIPYPVAVLGKILTWIIFGVLLAFSIYFVIWSILLLKKKQCKIIWLTLSSIVFLFTLVWLLTRCKWIILVILILIFLIIFLIVCISWNLEFIIQKFREVKKFCTNILFRIKNFGKKQKK